MPALIPCLTMREKAFSQESVNPQHRQVGDHGRDIAMAIDGSKTANAQLGHSL
jgi:hypothetical protein